MACGTILVTPNCTLVDKHNKHNNECGFTTIEVYAWQPICVRRPGMPGPVADRKPVQQT